jgi:hypothetical protein
VATTAPSTKVTTAPSIKGRFFEHAAIDVRALFASGDLARDRIARWLGPADQAAVRAEVDANGWYDIRLYARLLAFLRDIEGGGSDDYLRARGSRNAERVLAAGLYSQLEYLNHTQADHEIDPGRRLRALGRDLKVLSTISASIFNFTRWNPVVDPDHPDRYRIEVSDAGAFPDEAGFTSEGFMNRSHRCGPGSALPDLWRFERASHHLVLFRMTRAG